MKHASALILALLAGSAYAQVTCSTVGTFTTCSDGTSYSRIGNNVYGSDGSSANRIGNSTYINPPPAYPQQIQPIRPIQPYQPPVQPFMAPRCGYNIYGVWVCG